MMWPDYYWPKPYEYWTKYYWPLRYERATLLMRLRADYLIVERATLYMPAREDVIVDG